VKAQRSGDSLYAAGRWSVSFEEQLTSSDFQCATSDPVTAAALRGFNEEFGLSADDCRVRIVSAAVEFPIVNPMLIAVIAANYASADFEKGRQAKEIDDISFIDISADELSLEAEQSDLHPTSAIRIKIYNRLWNS
jgi:hypothetical protein